MRSDRPVRLGFAGSAVQGQGKGGMSVNNRGKKILLVDDDQNLRTVLAEQLDLYDGFTTIQVGSAAEGLEKA